MNKLKIVNNLRKESILDIEIGSQVIVVDGGEYDGEICIVRGFESGMASIELADGSTDLINLDDIELFA